MTDITAKVIADSYNDYNGSRITTLQLRYPRFIHSEFMTHRMFSRNASSSRAIPVQKEVDKVFDNPALPVHVGANQPGMQAYSEVNEDDKATVLERLRRLGEYVAGEVQLLNEAYGVHKQVLNRYLEPWQHIDVVVTATEWSNFFKLRYHEAAEPHIYILANEIIEAINRSKPEETDWHLPYYTPDLDDIYFDEAKEVCVARCARVSYRNHDGTFNTENDLILAKRLWESKHLSPFEHIAGVGADRWYANFYGWKSMRYQSEEKE